MTGRLRESIDGLCQLTAELAKVPVGQVHYSLHYAAAHGAPPETPWAIRWGVYPGPSRPKWPRRTTPRPQERTIYADSPEAAVAAATAAVRQQLEGAAR